VTWNYRIIRTEDRGETWYAVHEVFYNVQGADLWTENPVRVIGETTDDIYSTLARMMKALSRPVLEVVDDKLQEVT